MSRHLAIDADVLVYESAFAAQKTRYHLDGQTFGDSQACQTWCEENEKDYRQLRKDGDITTDIELLPPGAVKAIVLQKLSAIQEACGCHEYTLYLSGDGNFRDQVAVTKGYKANRANTPKPQHYQVARNIILDNPHTVYTTGVEADDALGIALGESPDMVVCSIDKDLNMLPGLHYDWNKGLKYRVQPADAIFFFLKQLLTGDSTDNIPGVPGMGDKKAQALLEVDRGNLRAMWASVLAIYEKGPFKFKDGTMTTSDLAAYLDEQGQLLWIQRLPEERWSAPYFTKRYIA